MRIQVDTKEGMKEHSTFLDAEEFTIHQEIWLIDHRKRFTKSEIRGMEQLIECATTIPGVCLKSINAIINDPMEEQTISRSTFKRMVKKCVQFGMMNVFETILQDGSQGGNLYVFNRYPTF